MGLKSVLKIWYTSFSVLKNYHSKHNISKGDQFHRKHYAVYQKIIASRTKIHLCPPILTFSALPILLTILIYSKRNLSV